MIRPLTSFVHSFPCAAWLPCNAPAWEVKTHGWIQWLLTRHLLLIRKILFLLRSASYCLPRKLLNGPFAGPPKFGNFWLQGKLYYFLRRMVVSFNVGCLQNTFKSFISLSLSRPPFCGNPSSETPPMASQATSSTLAGGFQTETAHCVAPRKAK